jgi:glutamate racemase
VAKEDRYRRVQKHSSDQPLIRQAQTRQIRLHALPIGVFDSGVGGLSVLRALQAELPQENLVYVADSGHAPYGERDDRHVLERSHAITDYLIAQHHIKALVVACNTATAAAIHALRLAYPSLPVIGIEPALKPAATRSKTGCVGVMATRGTLQSDKFQHLLQSLQSQAEFLLQPCDGLADAIEHSDTHAISELCRTYIDALGTFGHQPGQMDTLVLGCTHYPFVADQLALHTGPGIPMLEGGGPVARQTRRLLQQAQALAMPADTGVKPRTTLFFSTGNPDPLEAAVTRWLGCTTKVYALGQ